MPPLPGTKKRKTESNIQGEPIIRKPRLRKSNAKKLPDAPNPANFQPTDSPYVQIYINSNPSVTNISRNTRVNKPRSKVVSIKKDDGEKKPPYLYYELPNEERHLRKMELDPINKPFMFEDISIFDRTNEDVLSIPRKLNESMDTSFFMKDTDNLENSALLATPFKLPVLNEKTFAENQRIKFEESLNGESLTHTTKSKNANSQSSFIIHNLSSVEEGRIGKIQIYESGKTCLKIGNHEMTLKRYSEDNSEKIFAISNDKTISELSYLGNIAHKYFANPSFE